MTAFGWGDEARYFIHGPFSTGEAFDWPPLAAGGNCTGIDAAAARGTAFGPACPRAATLVPPGGSCTGIELAAASAAALGSAGGKFTGTEAAAVSAFASLGVGVTGRDGVGDGDAPYGLGGGRGVADSGTDRVCAIGLGGGAGADCKATGSKGA